MANKTKHFIVEQVSMSLWEAPPDVQDNLHHITKVSVPDVPHIMARTDQGQRAIDQGLILQALDKTFGSAYGHFSSIVHAPTGDIKAIRLALYFAKNKFSELAALSNLDGIADQC